MIISLAALEKWEIHRMDVITAYLLGKLDEDIYMMQPEGFVKLGMKKDMVCRLLCSLYRLKQAAQVWNLKIHIFLVKVGFRQIQRRSLSLYRHLTKYLHHHLGGRLAHRGKEQP
jgi:hypothetical protein